MKTATKYEWTRDEEMEDGGSHRVYRAVSKYATWTADRSYSPGDRALNHGGTSWELKIDSTGGYGSFIFQTLAVCKAFVETPLAAEYVRWVNGNCTHAEFETFRNEALADYWEVTVTKTSQTTGLTTSYTYTRSHDGAIAAYTEATR